MTAAIRLVGAASGDHRCQRRPGPLAKAGLVLALATFFICCVAQPASAVRPTRAGSVSTTAGESWQELTSAQKQFLLPLERSWSGLDPQQRRKWTLLSARAPGMAADERERIQTRMTQWATLTPEQRGQARLRYQEIRQLPAQDRQARWDAYQSLTPAEKQQLAVRAAQRPQAASRPVSAASGTLRATHEQVGTKSNIVPNPALAAPPRPIGPALLQATPGVTTNLISRRPTPPAHQQVGMPKIAATPEFVDSATLLPQRDRLRSAASRPAGAASGVEGSHSPSQ